MSGRICDGAMFDELGSMMFAFRVTEYGGWWRIGEDEKRHWVEE